MNLFSLFGGPDINAGVVDANADENGILLDVRSRDEFSMGHIEGAVCIPLEEVSKAARLYGDKNLYVYCLSGARSGQACATLKRLGVQNVTNIGGLSSWRGSVVAG